MRRKLKRRLSLWLIGFLLVCTALGAFCFCFLGVGYELELWRARFDSEKWIQNTKTDRLYSCRRPPWGFVPWNGGVRREAKRDAAFEHAQKAVSPLRSATALQIVTGA